jgi:hypothetical protein
MTVYPFSELQRWCCIGLFSYQFMVIRSIYRYAFGRRPALA